MTAKPSSASLQDVSDLAALWAGAVFNYTKNTGLNLSMDRSRSMDDVMKDTRQKLEAFEAYRHPNTRSDRVRSSFSKTLNTIEKVLNGALMASNGASSIFPAAMPASLLFSAFGYVLQSFSNVSADYDKVESFFNRAYQYFDTLSILENHMPQLAPFQRCVTRVFSAQLQICSISQGYTKEKHRFKKWFDTLSNGQDEDLKGAYSAMDDAINESLEQATLLQKLPLASGAAFNDASREFDLKCLPNTRVELLDLIRTWSDNPNGKHIFWLNGMVGTGKSTISRTIADMFAKEHRLGGSFFFTRGRSDLTQATKLFTTLAYQLAAELPPYKKALCDAIRANPEVAGNYLSDQWQQLFMLPLNSLDSSALKYRTWIIVIDALDECKESSSKIEKILQLLAQAQDITTIRLQIFLTSRPEPAIRLGLSYISTKYQRFVLSEVPRTIVDRDIGLFIKHQLDNIKYVRKLPENWPGQDKILLLVHKTHGLFIYASTICRFILNRTRSATKQLAIVLEGTGRSPTEKLDEMYTQVLTHSVTRDSEGEEKEELIAQFKQVVGSIAILFHPLSAAALANLLRIEDEERETMDLRLDELHSVLDFPESPDAPIRLLHTSFRDFLLDDEKRLGTQFRINGTQTHCNLAESCLQVMSDALTRDICRLKMPGAAAVDIDPAKVQECIPPELRYACKFWVWHLESGFEHAESGLGSDLLDQIYTFLMDHLLHWLEALSLLGEMYQSIRMISALCTLVQTSNHPQLFDLAHDAYRFGMTNCSMIARAPLQVYCAALIFSPSKSKVRACFEGQIPSWIKLKSVVPPSWDSLQQTLEGHSAPVWSVVISSDGQKIMSGSWDKTIKFWDAESGSLLQTLKGHPVRVWSISLSNDGQKIVSGSEDSIVRVWDAGVGSLLQELKGHTARVWAVAISSDGRQIVSGSCDKTARVWDAESGSLQHILKGHIGWVRSVGISSSGQKIVTGSWDKTLRVWDAQSGALLRVLEGHLGRIWSVAISHDGRTVVSAGWDQNVLVWDTETGSLLQTLEGHSGPIEAVTISSDSQRVLSGSWDDTIKMWDTRSGSLLQTFRGHSDSILTVAISGNGQKIVSGAQDKTIRLWDVKSGSQVEAVLESHAGPIWSLKISGDGRRIVSGSRDTTVRVWDAESGGSLLRVLEGHSGPVESVAISNDGQKIISGSDDQTIRIWDMDSGLLLRTLEGHTSPIESVTIFDDDQQIVSRSDDKMVRVWDMESGSLLQTRTADVEPEPVDVGAVSSDSKPGRLHANDRWIVYDEKAVILLPENRQVLSHATQDSMIVLASRSGIVTVLGLDLDELHRQVCM